MNARTMAVAGMAAILLAGGGAVADIIIQTIPVGNVGNTPDNTGYGAVDYEYNIGKYEVSNAEYVEFLNAVDPAGTNPHDLYSSEMGSGYGGIRFTPGNPDGSKYQVRLRRGNRPVNFVSFWDACRFANWLHNGQDSGDTETGAYALTPDAIANNTVIRNPDWEWAVCSEDEWYKAAYYDAGGSVYYNYPTGSDTPPTPEVPPGTDMVNGSANYAWAVVNLTDVGAYAAKPSDSPYGTFDQGGNVWEWNEGVREVDQESYRCVRGGSLFSVTVVPLHALFCICGDPLTESSTIGFRVAQVPEPACLAVLALGGVGLLARRRGLRR